MPFEATARIDDDMYIRRQVKKTRPFRGVPSGMDR